MIEIELYSKDGDVLTVDEHPTYLDFPARDSRTTTRAARLEIATENVLAPTIARYFNGVTPMGVYPRLTADRADLSAKHPTREDGLRLIAELLKWHARWPEGRFRVTGAEHVSTRDRFALVATQPRFSDRSLTADPFSHGVRFLVDADETGSDRMDELDEDEIADFTSRLALSSEWERVSWQAMLQRDTPVKPGTGLKSKGGKKAKAASAGMVIGGIISSKTAGREYDQTTITREVYSVRVPAEAKTELQRSGVGAELIAMLANALKSGKTVDEIRAGLAS